MSRSPFVPEGVSLSPLPWKASTSHPGVVIDDDGEGVVVAEARFQWDAAFIAHACSAYQELAEALEEAVEHMPDVTTYQRERVRRVEALLQRCREFAERGGRRVDATDS